MHYAPLLGDYIIQKFQISGYRFSSKFTNMLIYLSSYPRSGNSLMQDLVGNFFERPITGVEEKSKLIFTKSTENWRYYNGTSLSKNQEELQSLAANIDKKIFQKIELDRWLVLYDLNVPPYTKDNISLLPGCGRALTRENRQKLASKNSYIFVKTHGYPYQKYFENEYVVQIVRHPKLVFDSYLTFIKTNYGKAKTITEIIRGKGGCGSWSKWHQKWEPVRQSQENTFLRLRFEDILLAPLSACDRIKNLIGLDFNRDAKLTSFEELHKRNPNYYRSGSIDDSQYCYAAKEISLMQKLHGKMMRRLGYE